MNITDDYCFWCEERITKTPALSMWLNEDGDSYCLFHPANYNALTFTINQENANHATIEEVHKIIVAEYHREKAIRNREPLRSVEDNVPIRLPKNAQRTSRAAAIMMLPHTGTIRRMVYEEVKAQKEYGRTDFELEIVLRGKHQTISSSRRSLVLDGWLVDSGKTRKNEQGNECIVWVEKDEVFSGVLFNA